MEIWAQTQISIKGRCEQIWKWPPVSQRKASETWTWWCMPIIPRFGRLRQKDCEFKANLGHIYLLIQIHK
jgi:hypothetical protein